MKAYIDWSLRQLYLAFFMPTQFTHEIGGLGNDVPEHRVGARFLYLLKMLPWIIILASLGNIICGYTCELKGVDFQWDASWFGVAGGLTLGLISSSAMIALGEASDLMFSESLTIMSGLIGGILVGRGELIEWSWAHGLGGIVLGTAIGGVNGLLVAFGENQKRGVRIGVALGIASGLVFFAASTIAGNRSGGIIFGIVFGAAISFVLDASASILVNAIICTIFGVVSGLAISVTFGESAGMATGLAVLLTSLITSFRLITYPFDVIISAAAYLWGLRHPEAVRQAWRWCPVTWNEVIWVPLLFSRKLLAQLVQQDPEEGFKQIKFIAVQRKRQRRIAITALAEVAAKNLKSTSTLEIASVPTKLNWMIDVPGELNSDLMKVLSQFDHVAQHVEQFVTLNRNYLKCEALKRAVTEVQSLRDELLSKERSYATQLLEVLDEWRDILASENALIIAHAASTREILNPFIFGNPVAETDLNIFTGRQDIIKPIEASVLDTVQSPTLLLYGPRRMGKTSILNQLPRLLGPSFAPATIDCQFPAVTSDLTSLLYYISYSISTGLRKRRILVEPLARSELESKTFAAFDEWLKEIELLMPKKMRVLLCIDEYERLQVTLDTGWGEAFLDALRHIIQHRPRLMLMFTGAHTFQDMGPQWTDHFISVRPVRVSFLKPEEVIALLTRPIPDFGLTYTSGALNEILQATNGQPFLTQAVAFELVQFMNEKHQREAKSDDVKEAVNRALVSGGAYFDSIWNDSREEGKAILRSIVKDESPPDYPTARTWLEKSDVISERGVFAVPMVHEWVKRKVQ
jgi:hypothetical protein